MESIIPFLAQHGPWAIIAGIFYLNSKAQAATMLDSMRLVFSQQDKRIEHLEGEVNKLSDKLEQYYQCPSSTCPMRGLIRE